MTLDQLASLFNLIATLLLVFTSAFIAQRYPSRFFLSWTCGFCCTFIVLACEFLALRYGRLAPISFVEILFHAGANWFVLRTGDYLSAHERPLKPWVGLFVSLYGLIFLALALGVPFAIAVIPTVLVSAVVAVRIGVIFLLRRGMAADFEHTAALGWPAVLYGLEPLIYPVVSGTPLFWLGFLIESFFSLQVGMGMIIFLLEETALRYRKERERLDRLKGDFLNAASHELRTPLTSIVGYAEFLEEEISGELNADQRGFTRQIQEGAKRLSRIVDDMLDFARLEAGTFKLIWQQSELNSLIREEVASLLPQAKEAGLNLEVDLPSEPLMIRMDPRRIGQVVLNLVGNAIKFTPAGGCIKLTAQVRGPVVRVDVSDSGIGITAEHQPYLFDKFYQVDPSITREHGGAGLGLAISRSLIEAHGGTIGFESTFGQGSTFWFTLRLAETEVPALPGYQASVSEVE